MQKFVRILIILVCAVSVSACSCTERLRRLMIQCPNCFETKAIKDTVIIPEFRFDTTLFFTGVTDTFTIEKERVQVQLIRRTDTMFVRLKVPADTVVKTIYVDRVRPVIVREKTTGEKIKDFFQNMGLWLLTVVVAILAVPLITNIIKSRKK